MFLEPFISDTEVVKIVKEKILSKTPFALTRFGDGEIFILNRNASEHFLIKNCREWGYDYPTQVNNFYNDANKILIDSLKSSDMIGLMNKNCNIISPNFFQHNSIHQWTIQKSLVRSFNIDPNNLQICNHMISREKIFGSANSFKDIIQGQDFHIISANTNKLKSKNLSKIFDVNVSYTQHNFNINFNNRKEFIDNFKNIKENIVIFGVGLQKDYGVILKKQYNKIALDMGATMDAWASIYSRQWFQKDSLQDYLVI